MAIYNEDGKLGNKPGILKITKNLFNQINIGIYTPVTTLFS